MPDAKTAYWTLAWLNMGAIVALAWRARGLARRKDIAAHRRGMLAATALLGVFLVSYAAKLAFLGREAVATWEAHYRLALRVHELCVAAMLIGGGIALWQAHRAKLAPGEPVPQGLAPAQLAASRRAHRNAGMVAVIAGTAAIVTAGYVLAGMYARLGASG